MSNYGQAYLIGRLYPRGVRWFSSYSSELDDLMGPNLVMVRRERGDLIRLLSEDASSEVA